MYLEGYSACRCIWQARNFSALNGIVINTPTSKSFTSSKHSRSRIYNQQGTAAHICLLDYTCVVGAPRDDDVGKLLRLEDGEHDELD